MNFITFAVATTNIFPCANSKTGGQLMTEFNLRSRESVATNPDVKYMIGPSYVHAMEDFYVHPYLDGSGTVVSNTILVIDEGRGVINGHYLESLVPVHIDLAAANARLISENLPKLSGRLCVGLKAMYSTKATIAGSLIKEFTEDEQSEKYNMYEGIQVVILPKSEFFLPEDRPNDEDQVTAHLKLAEFSFINGKIKMVSDDHGNYTENNPDKIYAVDAARIGNVDAIISDTYVTKTGLDVGKLYIYSGKGKESDKTKSNWCQAQDSLVVWDSIVEKTTDKPKDLAEATFESTPDGAVALRLPHKQIDGGIQVGNTTYYYKDRVLELPKADFASGSGGTVTKAYTNRIKEINRKLNNIYTMTNGGKQRGFIDILTAAEELPPINSKWNYGDYILVGQDSTVADSTDNVRAPSTMYVVLPGRVTSLKYTATCPSGRRILLKEYASDDRNVPNTDDLTKEFTGTDELGNTYKYRKYEALFDIAETEYSGILGINPATQQETGEGDYFQINVTTINEDSTTNTKPYYYIITSLDVDRMYSTPVYLTGETPLATEALVGGFLNVPETATDAGYIMRDEEGHLVLLDYTLLRSGVLAYQLGEDFATTAGGDNNEVQSNLDEYVNQRVAFPNTKHIQEAEDPNVINITLNLTASEDPAVINLYDIDCRFNTAVFLHIRGTANENTVINISDCARIRIDDAIEGSPIINLYRSGLYYSATVLDRLNIIQDMNLWYSQFRSYNSVTGEYLTFDADLQIDGMTVRRVDNQIVANEIDYWSNQVTADNHYMCAMKSVSFSPSGDIIGVELMLRNGTSVETELGHHVVVSEFSFPQSTGLQYPETRLTKPLQITGAFTTAVRESGDAGCYLTETNFTAVTEAYDPEDVEHNLKGTIAIHANIQHIDTLIGVGANKLIPGWESDAWHTFSGGVNA